MISLTCTNCKTTLEMDDAFAGGVCRCQYCGTIQTVPSHLKGSATATSKAKSLYQGSATARGGGGATGLDALADVVASSGLSRSSLQRGAAPTRGVTGQGAGGPDYQRARPAAGGNKALLLLVAGGVIAVLLGVIGWLVFRPSGEQRSPANANAPGNTTNSQNDNTAPTGNPPNIATPSGPHFINLSLDKASHVVYLIDRGDSARSLFDPLKAAVFSSMESLGPERDFALIFWSQSHNKDFHELSFPEKGAARATPQQIENCRRKFQDLMTSGSTDIAAAVAEAMARKPDTIILVTAKGVNLSDGDVGAVDKARHGGNTRIYTFDLTNGDGKAVLQPIAAKSGGTYTPVSANDLR